MADARTSGTAVTRIFSILQVNNRNEDAAFAYMKKLRQNIQVYTKSGGGGTVPVGLGQAGRRHLLHRRCAVHPAERLRRADLLPQGRHRLGGRMHRPGQGQQESGRCGKKLIDWATSPACSRCWRRTRSTSFPPIRRSNRIPDLAAVLKQAKIIEIDDALGRRQPQAHRRALGGRSPERRLMRWLRLNACDALAIRPEDRGCVAAACSASGCCC